MTNQVQPPMGFVDESGWHLTKEEDAKLQAVWVNTLARVYGRSLLGEVFYPSNALEHDCCRRNVEVGAMEERVGGFRLTEKGLPYAKYAFESQERSERVNTGDVSRAASSLVLAPVRLFFWMCVAAIRVSWRLIKGMIWLVLGAVVGFKTTRQS
jgi:hypothetical protein